MFFANILNLWVSSNNSGGMLIFGMRISNGFGIRRNYLVAICGWTLFGGNRDWEVILVQKIRRSYIERRTGKDRRRIFSFKGLIFKGRDRRVASERRSKIEVRENWVRVSRWSSAPLNHMKISKYILGKTSLTKNSP